MKNTNHQQLPKENIDINLREKDDKKNTNKNNIIDEKENNRVFGKDIKNSQNNSFISLGNSLVIQAKNNFKNKTGKEKVSNFNFNPNEKKVENIKLNIELAKNSDESESLSQIVEANTGSTPREIKEYQDLALANENIYKKDSLKISSTENFVDKIVKVGEYYVKQKSLNVNNINPNNSFTSQLQKNNNISGFYLFGKSPLDIDKFDSAVKNDPQYVVDFIRDIFKNLKETENINTAKHGYFSTIQDDINDRMRTILIDWIQDVHLKFKLNPETLYLTINLIDRYLNVKRIDRTKLQLVAVSAMLIASKYEEIYAPEVRDFVYITDKSYSKDEIIQMEYMILSTLDFDILQVSPYTFLKRYHFVTGDSIKSFYVAQFILEFSILEEKMLQYSSSMKAASSLYISRRLLNIDTPWTQNLLNHTTYSSKDLKPCVKDMCKILELIPNIKLRSCINKFSLPKYMEVAKMEVFN